MPLESMIRVSGVIEKLRFKTVYTEKDFKNSLIISKEVARLRDIRKNYYSGFVRETSNIFNDYSKTGDSGLIDSNKLVATLFSFRQNHKFYEERRGIEQLEISHTIDGLLGKNKDFITGKKDSSIILPAYLVLRAFREKNSNWLSLTLGRLTDEKLEVLNDSLKVLKQNLISSINTPAEKQAVKKVLDDNLNINYIRLRRKIYSLSTFERPRTEKKTYLTVKKPINKEKLASVRSRIESIATTSDGKLLKIFKESQRKHEFKDLTLIKDVLKVTRLGKNGKLVFDRTFLDKRRERLEKENSNDNDNKYEIELYKLLDSVFGKNNIDDLTAFMSLIGSGGGERYTPILSQERSEKFYKHARKITTAYRNVLETAIQDSKTTNNLATLLSKSFQNTVSGPPELNFQITRMLFEKYHGENKKIDRKQIEEFIKLPGMVEAIFSIRKLFTINIVKRQFDRLNVKDESSFFTHSTPYSRDTQTDILSKLHNEILIGDFTDYDEPFIHRLLVWISLEGNLQDRSAYFNHDKKLPYTEKAGGAIISANYPRSLVPDKPRTVKTKIPGLDIPIISEIESDGEKGVKLVVSFQDWPISDIPMDIDKQ